MQSVSGLPRATRFCPKSGLNSRSFPPPSSSAASFFSPSLCLVQVQEATVLFSEVFKGTYLISEKLYILLTALISPATVCRFDEKFIVMMLPPFGDGSGIAGQLL